MKKTLIFLFVLLGVLFSVSAITKDKMLKAGYVDITATESLKAIPKEGVESCNIIVFGFADLHRDEMKDEELHSIKEILDKEAPGTKNFLSIGGHHTKPEHLPDTTDTIVHNIIGQMNHVNNCYGKDKIVGVDLDLENAISGDIIAKLAEEFKSHGWLVSIAPQMHTTDYQPIVPSSPTNLGLTSGWSAEDIRDQYHEAVQSGNVDYIMLQPYNNKAVLIKEDGKEYNQNNGEFVKLIAKAMNHSDLFKKNKPKILIGTPNSQSAGVHSMFNPKNDDYPVHYDYDQAGILKEFNKDIEVMELMPNDYSNVDGIMTWSLNNDYSPSAFKDASATPGAFCSAIFGAKEVEHSYFTLAIKNTGKYNSASITLIVDGSYYMFLNQWDNLIPANSGEDSVINWGTESSHNQNPTKIYNNLYLNKFFEKGKKSFKATIQGNAYGPGYTDKNKPQWSKVYQTYDSTSGIKTMFTFEIGQNYLITINPDHSNIPMSLSVNIKAKSDTN